MSVNYASGLSHYPDKGKCGLPEKIESDDINEKIEKLAELIRSSKHFVALTGAGISTSVGIPDFRGPNGVWTLEEKGENIPPSDIRFDNATPSPTHLALNELEAAGYLKFLITQNVDGIHLRSGYPRNRLSILHGDMFIEECNACKFQFITNNCVQTMGRKVTGNKCNRKKNTGACRGNLIDTILDWEDDLPLIDLNLARTHFGKADLILCLGTSLQIEPAGSMPLINIKKRKIATKNQKKVAGIIVEPSVKKQKLVDNEKSSQSDSSINLVIINLQATKHDKFATLRIFHEVDYVMTRVCKLLNLTLPDRPKVSISNVVLKSRHTETHERLPWKVEILDGKEQEMKTKLIGN